MRKYETRVPFHVISKFITMFSSSVHNSDIQSRNKCVKYFLLLCRKPSTQPTRVKGKIYIFFRSIIILRPFNASRKVSKNMRTDKHLQLLCWDDVTEYFKKKLTFLPMKAMATFFCSHYLCSIDIAKSVYLPSVTLRTVLFAHGQHII